MPTATHADRPPIRTRAPAASALLLVLLAGVFLLEAASGAPNNDARLLALGALPDDGAVGLGYWRLFTFGFLHSNLKHLLLNVLLLLIAAPMVERRAGGGRMLLTFVVASVASGLAILAKHELWPASGVSVGASGGAFGLLAAALVLSFREPRDTPWRWILTISIAAGLGYSLLPRVSLIGHLAGLGAGAALFIPLSTPGRGKSREAAKGEGESG